MWKLVDVQIIYKKLYQRELVTPDWFFVIRNNSGVQIFRNDEKARQRHLPKMYTLVVTMNWNRFRKIFRIRFCIFYNRSELSHCVADILSGRSRPCMSHSVFLSRRMVCQLAKSKTTSAITKWCRSWLIFVVKKKTWYQTVGK